MAAAAAHLTTSSAAARLEQQLQQVPAIKIISDTTAAIGSCDLKKLVKDDDDERRDTNETHPTASQMTKCKSLLNMKSSPPKLALTQDIAAASAKCHQMMVLDDLTAAEAKGKTDGNHLSAVAAAFDSKLPCKQNNFFVGSNHNLFFAQHATGAPPRRLNRKCLSRINLNLYQHQPLILQPGTSGSSKSNNNSDSSKKMMFKKGAAKTTTLNHSQTSNELDLSCSLKSSKASNLEAFDRMMMAKPYSSSSIMNLERVADAQLNGGGATAPAVHSSTSSNQILSSPQVNDFVLSNNCHHHHHGSSQFRKGSNMYINLSGHDGGGGGALSPGLGLGYGLGYLRSSNMNLYKSSTSLNALDLELLDSVSVGSFDRESIYSNYANSECELSNYCLYDPVQFYVHPTTSQFHQAAKMTSVDNNEAASSSALGGAAPKLSNSMASLRINSSASNATKTNSKVISWLQNI